MKKGLVLSLLLLSMLLLSACQSNDHFVIINNSDGLIEVEYTIKDTKALINSCCSSPFPAKKALKDLDNHQLPWVYLSKDDYTYDEGVGKFTVKLLPNEVLQIENILNYHESDEGQDTRFDIASIRLTGAKGSLYYDGAQAQTQFISRTEYRSVYSITYY